jgi:Chalcone isomerase-like
MYQFNSSARSRKKAMASRVFACLFLAAGLLGTTSFAVPVQEVGVVECVIGDKTVKMLLTGSAVRTKHFLKIYTIDSYIEQGVKVRTPEDMIAIDQPKQLRICMLRSVDGPTMADAFTEILRINFPEPAFAEELKTVVKILESQDTQKGDAICFSHIPKVGLHCKTANDKTYLIRNVDFSKAVWGNYFGKHNVSEAMKKNLLSRLPKE